MRKAAFKGWMTCALGACLLAGGLAIADPPANGGADDQTSCVADCQTDTDTCAKLCKEHAAKMEARCVQMCKEQQKKCVKECKEPADDGQ